MAKRVPPNRKADRPVQKPKSPRKVEVRSNDAGISDTLKPVRPTPTPKQGDRRNDK